MAWQRGIFWRKAHAEWLVLRGRKLGKGAGKCLGGYLGVFEDFHEGHGEVQGVVALRIVIGACSGIFESKSSKPACRIQGKAILSKICGNTKMRGD